MKLSHRLSSCVDRLIDRIQNYYIEFRKDPISSYHRDSNGCNSTRLLLVTMDENQFGGGPRIVFGDITNNQTVHTGDSTNKEKKEQKNKYMREYRARKKSELSAATSDVTFSRPMQEVTFDTPTQATSVLTPEHIDSGEVQITHLSELSDKQKREQKSKYMREWRARKKAELSGVSSTTTPGNPMQATTILPSEQREDTNKYLREWRAMKRANLSGVGATVSKIDTSGTPTQTVTFSPSEQSEDLEVRRSVITENKKKEERNRKQHGVMQCHTTQIPNVHEAIPDNDYVEFDSALFEPANEGGVDDEHMHNQP
uniref:Uncharacterized protein n=1 Tax=Oryza glumipatula TaxID=40148 RepID=A0A0E0AE38_9ORYZ